MGLRNKKTVQIIRLPIRKETYMTVRFLHLPLAHRLFQRKMELDLMDEKKIHKTLSLHLLTFLGDTIL